jgi:hypothetical protein
MPSSITSPTAILGISRAQFLAEFGKPDLTGALCGYTREDDTRAVLTLLCHAAPRRVLEIGTALGHMTANLTRWSPNDARVLTLYLIPGMPCAVAGAAEQEVDVPTHSEWGRFANHFGTAHKAFFVTADSMTYDFGRLAPLEFVFIDGGHDLEHILNDSWKAYDALVPGSWLVWHDFNSPVPWVKVREAIEQIGFAEPDVHVEGTEVAFLRKGDDRRPSPHPPFGHPLPVGARDVGTITRSVMSTSAVRGGPERNQRHQPANRPVLVAWEGDFEGLHSLALVNRAVCRELLRRGYDLGLLSDGMDVPSETAERVPLDPRLAARLGRGPDGGTAQVHVRHRWPPRPEPPPHGRWVLMQGELERRRTSLIAWARFRGCSMRSSCWTQVRAIGRWRLPGNSAHECLIDPFVLFNLGAIAIEQQDWPQALEYRRHSLAGSAPTDSITRKLYALIARAHQMLREPEQALAACAAGLAFDPNDGELLFREAIVRRQTGDHDGAERCWRRILTLRRPDQFSSVDQGIYGHLTRRNLAALAPERGDHGEATRLWRAVRAECPDDREALNHL